MKFGFSIFNTHVNINKKHLHIEYQDQSYLLKQPIFLNFI